MKRSLLLFGIPFIVLLAISFILFGKSCDYVMANKAEKAIPFDHKSHLVKMDKDDAVSIYGISDCTDCHGYYSNGRFKGIPTVETCVGCHSREGSTTVTRVDGRSLPARKPMFDDYKDSDSPWESYARQPSLVYFSHLAVMEGAKEHGTLAAQCAACHGNKAESRRASIKTEGMMPMGQCMDCHTALKLSNKCAVCHD